MPRARLRCTIDRGQTEWMLRNVGVEEQRDTGRRHVQKTREISSEGWPTAAFPPSERHPSVPLWLHAAWLPRVIGHDHTKRLADDSMTTSLPFCPRSCPLRFVALLAHVLVVRVVKHVVVYPIQG